MKSEEAINFIISKMREELPDYLVYHSLDHTLEVIENARTIATYHNIKGEDLDLLLTAAAFHDSGLLHTYEDHESVSCNLAREHLPQFEFTDKEIQRTCLMISATRLPQSPENELSQILCDADLSYLGGPNYDYISNKLLLELENVGYDLSGDRWLKLQINFLKNHHYWTEYSLKFLREGKEKVLAKLEHQLSRELK